MVEWLRHSAVAERKKHTPKVAVCVVVSDTASSWDILVYIQVRTGVQGDTAKSCKVTFDTDFRACLMSVKSS